MDQQRHIDVDSLKVVEPSFDALICGLGRKALQAFDCIKILFLLRCS